VQEIHITMKDILNDNNDINRVIDISNFYVHDCSCSRITYNPDIQHRMLTEWITERGNEQHNTKLQLISWYIK